MTALGFALVAAADLIAIMAGMYFIKTAHNESKQIKPATAIQQCITGATHEKH